MPPETHPQVKPGAVRASALNIAGSRRSETTPAEVTSSSSAKRRRLSSPASASSTSRPAQETLRDGATTPQARAPTPAQTQACVVNTAAPLSADSGADPATVCSAASSSDTLAVAANKPSAASASTARCSAPPASADSPVVPRAAAQNAVARIGQAAGSPAKPVVSDADQQRRRQQKQNFYQEKYGQARDEAAKRAAAQEAAGSVSAGRFTLDSSDPGGRRGRSASKGQRQRGQSKDDWFVEFEPLEAPDRDRSRKSKSRTPSRRPRASRVLPRIDDVLPKL